MAEKEDTNLISIFVSHLASRLKVLKYSLYLNTSLVICASTLVDLLM